MAEELDELELRRRALTGTEVRLLAGGDTPQERRALRYRLEDAVLATGAAIRSGVVEGMGLTALRVLRGDTEAVTAEVALALEARTALGSEDTLTLAKWVVLATRNAYAEAASRVISNARRDPEEILGRCIGEGLTYNALRNTFHLPSDNRVLGPADTDVEVLRGAMSIAGLFATSNQTLLMRPSAGQGLD
jgi:chaperonin GroEL